MSTAQDGISPGTGPTIDPCLLDHRFEFRSLRVGRQINECGNQVVGIPKGCLINVAGFEGVEYADMDSYGGPASLRITKDLELGRLSGLDHACQQSPMELGWCMLNQSQVELCVVAHSRFVLALLERGCHP